METEELNDSSSPSIEEIATNGDIILVVGPEKRKLQVNSCVLKNASKVFTAMFGPHFREGQDLHGNSPKEISMPDDNTDALTIICRILHLRNDSLPHSLTPREILQVAIAADKFDCVMRLTFHTAKWLNPRNTQDILELGRLSVASYILNDAWAFGQLTFTMISRSRDSYIPLAGEFSDHIPQKTFCLIILQKVKRRARKEVFHYVFQMSSLLAPRYPMHVRASTGTVTCQNIPTVTLIRRCDR